MRPPSDFQEQPDLHDLLLEKEAPPVFSVTPEQMFVPKVWQEILRGFSWEIENATRNVKGCSSHFVRSLLPVNRDALVLSTSTLAGLASRLDENIIRSLETFTPALLKLKFIDTYTNYRRLLDSLLLEKLYCPSGYRRRLQDRVFWENVAKFHSVVGDSIYTNSGLTLLAPSPIKEATSFHQFNYQAEQEKLRQRVEERRVLVPDLIEDAVSLAILFPDQSGPQDLAPALYERSLRRNRAILQDHRGFQEYHELLSVASGLTMLTHDFDITETDVRIVPKVDQTFTQQLPEVRKF